MRSGGTDCHTRKVRSEMAAKTASEPITPSLSWIAVTPRAAATGSAARVASTSSACEACVKRSRNAHAALEVDHAAGPLEVAAGARQPGGVHPQRVPVVREQRGRRVAGDRVERLAARLPVVRGPAEAAQPALGRERGRDPVE